MNHALQVVIEHDKDGYFAFVPELKGCQTQGDSLDEVMKNIKEAIDLYWSTLRPAEIRRIVKRRVFTTSMPVSIGEASCVGS
ncbi:MAG: type II toxin-antitoxin system HicB family antitoxin [Flavobacteriales bacterium]|nr:type II toxin-antitoxin system HicB family antitoxin [Flavobacteriales bacterium]